MLGQQTGVEVIEAFEIDCGDKRAGAWVIQPNSDNSWGIGRALYTGLGTNGIVLTTVTIDFFYGSGSIGIIEALDIAPTWYEGQGRRLDAEGSRIVDTKFEMVVLQTGTYAQTSINNEWATSIDYDSDSITLEVRNDTDLALEVVAISAITIDSANRIVGYAYHSITSAPEPQRLGAYPIVIPFDDFSKQTFFISSENRFCSSYERGPAERLVYTIAVRTAGGEIMVKSNWPGIDISK